MRKAFEASKVASMPILKEVIINDIAMLFLTVLSISSLTQSVNQFIGYYEAVLAGAALVLILSYAINMKTKKSAQLETQKSAI